MAAAVSLDFATWTDACALAIVNLLPASVVNLIPAGINTRKSIREKLHHCQRPKTWWTWRVISIIAENKPHAHHETCLHTRKVYNTRPVYSATIEVFSEVLSSTKMINAFVIRPVQKSSTSFASIFPKLSSQSKAWRWGTSRFLFTVSTVSARNAWHHDERDSKAILSLLY